MARARAVRPALVLARAVAVAIAVGIVVATGAPALAPIAHAQPADASPAPDPTATAAARFDAATELMLADRHRDAADAFLALAAAFPDDQFADDALFTAARLLEERLGDPAAALAAYRELLVRYPDSRTALAASRRADALDRDLGPGDQGADVLAAFNDILQRFSDRPEADSIARAEALLAEHEGWPGAPRIALWLARVHERTGRLALAARWYDRVLADWPSPPTLADRLAAMQGAGDVALARGRHDDAERYFRALPADTPAHDIARRAALARLASTRRRHALYLGSIALGVLGMLGMLALVRRRTGSARATVRALWPPPVEVLFMAPIAFVLSAAGFTGHYTIGPAVTIVSAGGLLVAWLAGAALRRHPSDRPAPGRIAVLATAALSLISTISIIYIAIQREGLLDMLLETVRFGPDL